MTDPSNASYLILADKADDPGAMSAAICVLVARVEAAEKIAELRKAAVDRWVPCPDHRDKINPGYQEPKCQVCRAEAAEKKVSAYMTVMSNDMNDIVLLGLAKEELQHRLAEAEAANAGLREAMDRAAALIEPGYPLMAEELRLTIAAAPCSSRVADLVKASREFVQHCNACVGEGFIYPGWPEEEYGQAPGSSKRPCPYCAPLKTALASFPEPEPEVKDG
jgi:hypothetical protein